MQINNLEELLQAQLQSLFDIERQLVEAIPKLSQAANARPLKDALERHLEVTKEQRQRLEEIADSMGFILGERQDKGMANILAEGQELIDMISDPKLKDTAIMGGTEKVEMYESAAYESAKTVAQQLNRNDIADKLDETLGEERKAAENIKAMAKGSTLLGKLGEALS